jgi:hypothetical protein
LGVREERVSDQQERHDREPGLGAEQEPAAVDRVGDRAADDRDDEERHERAEAQQADGERRVGQIVELDRDGDKGDLAADVRDRLAGPQTPERRRVAERREVERSAAQQAAEARLALRCDFLGYALEESLVLVRASRRFQ